MMKLTSTLLGLTLVAASSATQAGTGCTNFYGATPTYTTPIAAAPYSSTYVPNTPGTTGATGCSSCSHGCCGTGTRTPYAPSVTNRSYSPTHGYLNRQYNARTPTNVYPTSNLYPSSTTYPTNSVYPTGTYSTPAHNSLNGGAFYGGY